MFLRLLPLLLAICTTAIPSQGAVAPASYAVEATIASVPKLGREPFGSKFFFADGERVIYRILPSGSSDGDPAARLEYWAPDATLAVLPATGYESLDIVALNSGGVAVGRNLTENAPPPNTHQEAALYWTPANGSLIPAGFDYGFSGFKALNASGQTAGFTDSGTYKTVFWDSTDLPSGVTEIVPPAGYGNCEVRGISANGEVLLYVSNPGLQNVAIWNGTTSTVIGPAPNSDETFYPSNCAIDANGDVAMAFFNSTGYRVIFVPAANRSTYQIFPFAGSGNSVYNVQISDAGLASCETSVNGANIVSIVSSTKAQQFTFDGYTAFLNAGGELVFGNQGGFYYWNAAAWAGAPEAVPLELPDSPSAPTLVGFNDDGRLLTLSDNSDRTVRTLSILVPVLPVPASATIVTLKPVHKTLRLTKGKSVRQRLVKTTISGSYPEGPVRYALRGKVPKGTRLRTSDGWLLGRPTRDQQMSIHVTATYSSGGVAMQSPVARIKAIVRAPASPQTQ